MSTTTSHLSAQVRLPKLALAVHQPWAWLLVHAAEYRNPKDVENRNWFTRFRGEVFIHATKKWGAKQLDDCRWVEDEFGVNLPESFDRGGIVGTVEIVDCVSQSASRWFCGKYGFVCANPRPLPFVACRGDRMFYTPPAEAVKAIAAALAANL